MIYTCLSCSASRSAKADPSSHGVRGAPTSLVVPSKTVTKHRWCFELNELLLLGLPTFVITPVRISVRSIAAVYFVSLLVCLFWSVHSPISYSCICANLAAKSIYHFRLSMFYFEPILVLTYPESSLAYQFSQQVHRLHPTGAGAIIYLGV